MEKRPYSNAISTVLDGLSNYDYAPLRRLLDSIDDPLSPRPELGELYNACNEVGNRRACLMVCDTIGSRLSRAADHLSLRECCTGLVPNTQGWYGCTMLHEAMPSGPASFVYNTLRALIWLGADATIANIHGVYPLERAIRREFIRGCILILTTCPWQETLLSILARENDDEHTAVVLEVWKKFKKHRNSALVWLVLVIRCIRVPVPLNVVKHCIAHQLTHSMLEDLPL